MIALNTRKTGKYGLGNDRIKTKWALKTGYILLRISYSEYDAIEDWIKKVIELPVGYNGPRLIMTNDYLYRDLKNVLYYN